MLALALAIGSQSVVAESGWVGTWGASQQTRGTAGSGVPSGKLTFRNIVHVSQGGTALRLQLSNEFGTTPLTVGEVHVALSAGSGAIVPGTDQAVTFAGSPSITIPPGAVAFSDGTSFSLPSFSNLAVSVYLPAQSIPSSSCHPDAIATNYNNAGNVVAASSLASSSTTWCYLRAVDVQSATATSAVVTLGDSITAGYQSPSDANDRWPDFLAANLQQNSATAGIGVVNEGVVGNLLLNAGVGPNGLARLDRDVLAQSGVGYLIVLEGINDLDSSSPPGSVATAQALIAGYEQIVMRAHNHGIKVFGATLTPDGGNIYFPANNDVARQTVNAWIRTSGVFDGVIDFDSVLTNGAVPPAIPALLPAYDSGDHMHPNAAGYQLMANTVNLALFQNSTNTTGKGTK